MNKKDILKKHIGNGQSLKGQSGIPSISPRQEAPPVYLKPEMSLPTAAETARYRPEGLPKPNKRPLYDAKEQQAIPEIRKLPKKAPQTLPEDVTKDILSKLRGKKSEISKL